MASAQIDPDSDMPVAAPGLGTKLRNYLLTGIIVAAPIAITAFIVTSVIDTIDGWVRPILPAAIQPIAVPGLGVVIVVVALILLGAITANVAGRFLLRAWESAISRLPLIRTIYRPLRQVFEMVMTPGSASFREVVLVEYPRAGIWVYGFVSAPLSDPAAYGFADEMASVYLPTSPNLYAGYLILVPRSSLRATPIGVDDAIRLIASAGLAGQPDRKSPIAVSRSNK